MVKFNTTFIKDKKGSKAEQIVWDAIKTDFYNRTCLAYLNYPIFSHDFSSRKEPDILILDKELGAIIIEVKGITINNLVAIHGHKWIYKDFYTSEGNPYQQAENQMYSLIDRLNNQTNIFNNITKRVVVALPYITKREWEDKGFHLMVNAPPILFKDDIENSDLHKKIESKYLTKSHKNLSEDEWVQIVELFSGTVLPELEVLEKVKYSYLYIVSTKEQFLKDIQYMKTLLSQGKKVIILSYLEKKENWYQKEFFEKYEKALLFQYFESIDSYLLEEPIIIIDGKGVDNTFDNKWFLKFPKFNKGQYKIEHAPIDKDLAITAGAGTGKTTVMIQRVMFLLAMKVHIQLKEIVMITFTKDSAKEMKNRLKEELILRYSVTNNPKYLKYGEELNEMNVNTIHSFAKMLLQELGFALGFGRNVKLKGYKVKRREIIEGVLDTFAETNKVETLGLGEFRHYELVKVIETYWDEMEKKGLSEKQIKDLNWGETYNSEDKSLNELFKIVFTKCEKAFNQLKQTENAITIGDLVRKISQISTEKPDTLRELSFRIKYLFVDEFQDSDDVQIKLFAQIKHIIGANLLVVGDIKQSIYRFRGADYTSFDQLKKHISENFIDEPLKINYRTSEGILKTADKYFQIWGTKGYLAYEEDDWLIGNEKSTYGEIEFKIKKYNKWTNELNNKLIDEILDAQQLIKNQGHFSKNKKIALLVRTNNQARNAQKLCEAHGIVTEMNIGGTFFNSDAVKDFYSLIESLLYPNHAKSVLNALATPFFNIDVMLDSLVRFEGNNDEILDFLRENYNLVNSFNKYVDELRIKPVFSVLRNFIAFEVLQTMYSKKLSNTQNPTDVEKNRMKFEVLQYEKNINHIMNLLHQQFDSTNATLYSIYSWLGINIKTNRDEDEPRIESINNEEVVEIVTVHKSKGLEYHTVIIPFTDQGFDFNRDEILFNDSKEEVGWFMEKKGNKNENHIRLDNIESEEIIKEETRLLYVAITRSRERFIGFIPIKPINQSWSMQLDILDGGN